MKMNQKNEVFSCQSGAILFCPMWRGETSFYCAVEKIRFFEWVHRTFRYFPNNNILFIFLEEALTLDSIWTRTWARTLTLDIALIGGQAKSENYTHA